VSTHEDLTNEANEAWNHYQRKGASRRDIVKRIGLGVLAAPLVGSVLAACTSGEDAKAVSGSLAADGKNMKVLGTNGGLAATWYAEGKKTMEKWARLYGMSLDWVDGELNWHCCVERWRDRGRLGL
jgi:hypothetical protein